MDPMLREGKMVLQDKGKYIVETKWIYATHPVTPLLEHKWAANRKFPSPHRLALSLLPVVEYRESEVRTSRGTQTVF